MNGKVIPIDAASIRRGAEIVSSMKRIEQRGPQLSPLDNEYGLRLAGQLAIAVRNAYHGLGEFEMTRIINRAFTEAQNEALASDKRQGG